MLDELREELIEKRKQELFNQFLKLNDIDLVFCEDCGKNVPNTSMVADDFTDNATEQVGWFLSAIQSHLKSLKRQLDNQESYILKNCPNVKQT